MEYLKRISGKGITAIVLLVIIIVFVVSIIQKESEPHIISSSQLQEAIEISELSTANFVYNGIAETVDEGLLLDKTYYVSYDSTVKVSIDFKGITFEIDHDEKIILTNLPDVSVNVATIDSSSINFIPQNPDLTLQDIYELCKKDAIEEANQSEELQEIAHENVQIVIETLLSPLLKKTEYTLAWEDEG